MPGRVLNKLLYNYIVDKYKVFFNEIRILDKNIQNGILKYIKNPPSVPWGDE